jgi:outer membrane protein assembly factor BamE (lipoprotein component of BamABCDE complex)
MKKITISLLLLISLTSCAAYQPNENIDGNMTVGTVQKEIKIGMSSVDVIKALGSPNIVQTDDDRNEVWIYDKISTQVNASSSHSGVWLLLFGGSSRSASNSSSQRTLTVVIKFDKKQKVKDFSYHTSRF